jgi:D-sedoheptulose 7-phosphate isomerase
MTNKNELAGLYPFLHGKAQDPAKLEAALLSSIADKARDSRETNARFFDEQADTLLSAARAVADVYRNGGRLFSMGNGGSSCDASHVAVEFVHPVTAGRPALAAINLVADIAFISAMPSFLACNMVNAVEGIVVSKPMPKNTTSRSGNLRASARASIGEHQGKTSCAT